MKALRLGLVAGAAAVVLFGCGKREAGPAGETGGSDSTGGGDSTPVFVNVGTGGVTGVYYRVGAALKQIMDAREDTGVRLSFKSTGGSVFNINSVVQGSMEVGVCQSDRQYQAVHGLAEWQGKPQEKLRAICSLHPEAVTFVASVESGIRSVRDAEGKTVNIGNPGSGQRQNAIDMLEAAGIDIEEDLQAENMKAADAPRMLQDGRIDAFFYTVGHPAGAIKEATAGRVKVRLVPIPGMEKFLAKHPYYAPVTIRHELYPSAENSEDIESVGMIATLVTSADVPDEVVYQITKGIFEGLEELRAMHPAFADLDPTDMLTRGISAPFHPGAEKYFAEVAPIVKGPAAKAAE